MSYSFPECLHPLRDFLKSQGADVRSFSTDRQAAFMAQQLIGSRVKFPERGQPMLPTLLKIQEALASQPKRPPLETAKAKSPVGKGAKHRARAGHPLRSTPAGV